ncbi:AraC family transcriptional regulator [Spirosoma foliorum]|uniref:Helix-turn-helix transcriptional regulator n=1 Tax=Spirosoma foliorum TaxID=2710596 RepID=A0A7G5H1A6_9BACT|nr:AraC family transcriptional regulator [Spirosoma foliorum]QMW04898.1 helix-turn-helix transcriptional regulator [Spirosoma foliorum]
MATSKKGSIPEFSLAGTSLNGIAFKKLGLSQPVFQEHNVQLAHRDDHYMLVVLTEGHLTYCIDFETHQIQAPGLLMVFPGQVHQLTPQTPLSGWAVSFEAVLLSEDLNVLLDKVWRDQIDNACDMPTPWFKQLENLLTVIGQLVDKPLATSQNAVTALVSGLLFMLAGTISGMGHPIKSTPKRSSLVKHQFLQLLYQHYKDWKKPSQYAERMHITTAHLNDTIKRVTGRTTTQAIQEQCVLEARRLLQYTDLDVIEIAYQIGYVTPSHFIKLFKLVTGLTPFQYRQKLG